MKKSILKIVLFLSLSPLVLALDFSPAAGTYTLDLAATADAGIGNHNLSSCPNVIKNDGNIFKKMTDEGNVSILDDREDDLIISISRKFPSPRITYQRYQITHEDGLQFEKFVYGKEDNGVRPIIYINRCFYGLSAVD